MIHNEYMKSSRAYWPVYFLSSVRVIYLVFAVTENEKSQEKSDEHTSRLDRDGNRP